MTHRARFEVRNEEVRESRRTAPVPEPSVTARQSSPGDLHSMLANARAPGVSDVLALQRLVGNRAVSQLLAQAPGRSRPASRAGAPPRAQPESINGVPASLRAGVEVLSGVSLEDVRVHYNSPQPPRLHALAFTRGSEIHLDTGQEEHLPHEVWHVVQQKQGRVMPTRSVSGVPVNDASALEAEAERLGGIAQRGATSSLAGMVAPPTAASAPAVAAPVQRVKGLKRGQRVRVHYNHPDYPKDGTITDAEGGEYYVVEFSMQEARVFHEREVVPIAESEEPPPHVVEKTLLSSLDEEPSGFGSFSSGTMKSLASLVEEPKLSPTSVTPQQQPPKQESKPTPSASAPKQKAAPKVTFTHRKESGGNVKVEIWEKGTGRYLGVVTVQYQSKSVLLHTNAAEGQGGQGMGGTVYRDVMFYMLDQGLIPNGYTVDLTIVGGAMLHLQTRKFSERFGDVKLHKQGEAMGQARKQMMADAPPSSSHQHLSDFNPLFITEHLIYLDALVAARRAGKLGGLQVYAQKPIGEIIHYFVKKYKEIPQDIMPFIATDRGANILELLTTLGAEDAREILQIYAASLAKGGMVGVSFVLSKALFEEFVGYGLMNKAGWLKRQVELM